jgi:hypothetical protein
MLLEMIRASAASSLPTRRSAMSAARRQRLQQRDRSGHVERAHQAQRARWSSCSAFLNRLRRRIRLVDDAAGQRMKLLGRGGRRDALLVPDEQRGAELASRWVIAVEIDGCETKQARAAAVRLRSR